jgi:hypothetical protein
MKKTGVQKSRETVSLINKLSSNYLNINCIDVLEYRHPLLISRTDIASTMTLASSSRLTCVLCTGVAEGEPPVVPANSLPRRAPRLGKGLHLGLTKYVQ